MAKKDKKKNSLTGTDIALAILAALGGSVLFMTVIAVAGSIVFPNSGRHVTAESPSARSSYYGTLPSRAPTQTPTPEPMKSAPDDMDTPEPSETVSNMPAPAPSQTPSQTQTPAPSRTQAPAAPTPTRTPATQNPGTVVSLNPTVPPVRQTQTPAQMGNEGGQGQGNADNFNTWDNPEQQNTSARRILNTNTMKIHYPSCSDVRRISPQNYSTSNLSESELLRQGYSVCRRCH